MSLRHCGRPSLDARQNSFGFLRILFATFVLISHSYDLSLSGLDLPGRVTHTMTFSAFGLYGFFAISGFMIVKSWLRAPEPRAFLGKRALRILPGFVVASLVAVYVVGPLASGQAVPRLHLLAKTVWNLLKLNTPDYPAPLHFLTNPCVNGAVWTIKWEFFCYLIAMTFGLLGLTGRRWPWLALLALCMAKMVHNAMIGLSASVELTASVPTFVGFFAAGASLYLYRDRVKLDARWALVAAAALLPLLFVPLLTRVGVVTLGVYALFTVGASRIPVVGSWGERNDLSYGLYLYAWPVQQLILMVWPHLNVWALTFAAEAVAVGLGFLSWRFIERPFLRMKRTLDHAPAAPEPIPVPAQGAYVV